MPVNPRPRRWRAALAGLVLVGTIAACGGDDDPGSTGPAVREADEGIDGVLAIRIPDPDHTTGTVDYDRLPPAGGDHNPTPAPCGFYTQAIPDEHIVHSLEHGAVWIAYDPDLDVADIARLQALVDGQADVIATPYADLPAGSTVVVSSWGRQLLLDAADDPRLEEFVEQYRRFKEAPEANIGCPKASDL